MALAFRASRAGSIAAGLFLLAPVTVFAWIFFVASKNPADSGESGILLVPFVMPWISMLPTTWLGPGTGIACILWNAFLLYCVFGGLRVRRATK